MSCFSNDTNIDVQIIPNGTISLTFVLYHARNFIEFNFSFKSLQKQNVKKKDYDEVKYGVVALLYKICTFKAKFKDNLNVCV